MYKCRNFGIKELVSPVVYQKFGDGAWMFFSEDVLRDLDTIRDTWGGSIIINNWQWNGTLKQCGLRSNLDQIPKDKTRREQLYLSAHCMGKAFDLHDRTGRNKKLWEHVYSLILSGKLKAFKRMENWKATSTDGGWVHVDSFQANNIIF